MPVPLAPLSNRNLTDHVYETLKSMIDEGALVPGEKIRRVELEHELGVSQTPINEALSRLAAEKFLYQESRRGFYVRAYSDHDFIDLFAVRSAIESMAARLCVEDATDEEIRELSGFFQSYTLPIRASEQIRYAIEDKVFHARIIRYSHNAAIKDLNENHGYIIKSNQRGLVRPPDETLHEHQALIDALVRRDADAASAAMATHHLKSREVLKQAVKLSGSGTSEKS